MDWLDKFRLGGENEPLEISTYTTGFRKLNKTLLLLSKIDNHQFVDNQEICLNEMLRRYVEDYREVYAYRDIQIVLLV